MPVEYSRVESLLQLVAEEGIETLELETTQFFIRIQRQAAEPTAMPLDTAPSDLGVAATDVQQVCAPVDGVFYRAASAGGTPLCEVGGRVTHGAPLGIIEAMKIMNQIMADGEGCVAEVLAADGEMVRQGQPLFIITRG
ncbi:acetyl-CoA carboxylase biotin carboxyl carrier protein subunit [Brenneria goodwinii]|uniref:Biotin carboxyl carrier protein of acetyl-CoA carboxylase n=1 Tax=Brenneria goodwinii TaxID=1109412 RepID=A0A0G4JR18_9GAMM|nr:biotin/lipoyl-containing protein [Brenneria goodwinii]ATA25315.1 hypothetical protein AWC36_14960 [Brenneria goodwinii]MCG8158692.1 acetyl-CoA carboxylase biotin carboxyl carrier protein subunit [Brenneria goodwinii]MCG8162913.1 acetyl-CoA carboxylase biotin carboxyl carrier protein subunit [Brenneria goodwinii]MCG8167394.1 acetyl-CoA carboxylase biotin carboxyl carrier protein subunit [Brenneria goodwinii]MCG8172054.1 acetyl-CoA carboxylase biotin carboxyl carrier protein subunit [Brenneri